MDFVGNKFRFSAILLFLSILTACGGGGGGSSSTASTTTTQPPPTPDPTGAVIHGNGQLGNIIAANVKILDISGTVLVTSVTDSEGDYGPVNLPSSHEGPVIIEISPAPDGSTFFVCDYPTGCPNPDDGTIFPFGDLVPYTATLSAVLPDEAHVNTANVNPITTAIRARAEALGLSAESIIQADKEMSLALTALLGVEIPTNIPTIPNIDLINVPASESSTTIAEVALSNLNAGLIALITPESGYTIIDDVINGLSANFANNGEIRISDVFNSGDVESGELLFAIEQQITFLSSEQPEAFKQVQGLTPESDLLKFTEDLATTRNEIAPVPPEITGTPQASVDEDSPYNFTPIANDPDGDTLKFSIKKQPDWSSFDPLTGVLSGTPGNADIGKTTNIEITVSDGTNNDSLMKFDITVVDIPPTISGAFPAATEDMAYSYTPTTTGAASFTATGLPDWADIDPLTGKITGTPTNDDVGSAANISIDASDANETASLTNLDLTVLNVNDAPTLTGTPPDFAFANNLYTFILSANDIDAGNSISFLDDLPQWATLDVSNPNQPTATGTPLVGDIGSTFVTISASDSIAMPTELQFTLEVTGGKFVYLTWDNPTTFADGSPLNPSDLFGFEITYFKEGQSPVSDLVTIGAGSSTVYTTPLLDLGTYTFAVKVFGANGKLSNSSNSLFTSVQ